MHYNIGKHFIVGISGPRLTSAEAEALKNLKPLGLIFFQRNFDTGVSNWQEVFKELTLSISDCTEGETSIFSIDFEGGRVNRFPNIPPLAPNYPYAKDWAGRAFQTGFESAKFLRSLGINLNYAPVLDVDLEPINPVIGPRAFSSNPMLVSAAAKSYSEGSMQGGVLTCLKHFPGHGRTNKDSHFELPFLNTSSEDLEVDLLPFKELIKFGSQIIMTAHVKYQNLDSEYPASLSNKIITGLLREKLSFDGIVMTDDFDMKALSYLSPLKRAQTALLAGTDVLLIGNGMTSNALEQSTEIANQLSDIIHSGDTQLLEILNSSALRITNTLDKLKLIYIN